MKGRLLTKETISNFINRLQLEEKSENTIEKYARDVKAFAAYLDGEMVCKELVIEYKQKLINDGYAVSSINSMLAAINSLFDYLGWIDCKVKEIKTQRQIYCPENKELSKAEYLRLIEAAERNHNHRLNMILQTICGTGIRISELKFITVEAVKSGTVEVACKGKNRVIFIGQNINTIHSLIIIKSVIPECLCRGSSSYFAVYNKVIPLFNTTKSAEDSRLQPRE